MAINVLFLCNHNDARSVMAEEFLRYYGGENFMAESAGTQPVPSVDEMAVRVMEELELDVSHHMPRSCKDLNPSDYHYVIALYDRRTHEVPPHMFGSYEEIVWGMPNPADIEGSDDERRKAFEMMRDLLLEKVREFVKDHKKEKNLRR